MSAYKGSLRTYNELYRKGDEIYHSAVKAFDISDGAFWVLYTLRDIGPQPTQRDVYKSTCMPKQTVNSALNRLESEGFIELHGETGSRTRTISLTESGEALARARRINCVPLSLWQCPNCRRASLCSCWSLRANIPMRWRQA